MSKVKVLSETQIGAAFQKDLQTAMVEVSKTMRLFHLRLYDTTSARARAYLPAQPGDYILTFPGGSALLEAKASLSYTSFADAPKEMLEAHQGASARKFKRAQGDPYVVFRSDLLGTVELWDGELAALMAIGTVKASDDPKPLRECSDTPGNLCALVAFIVMRPFHDNN